MLGSGPSETVRETSTVFDPGPLTTSVQPAPGHAGRFVNTYAPWASVVVEKVGRVLVIVTVAPASGTLFVPDEPPGANASSRVIVPWSTRWAEAGAIAWRSAALTRTTEPVRACTLTFVNATSTPFSTSTTRSCRPTRRAPLVVT